jgi:RNA polymerase-binding transcription factor DksA
MEATYVREILESERVTTLARIRAMAEEFEGIVDSAAESNNDDEHDPEGSTIAFERAQLAALLDEARSMLSDLDRALTKLADGKFGLCEHCGAEIEPERLLALPTTRLCISCAASGSADG